MRKADSHLDFDLELAKKHTAQNPVYYVQYAHARICSILEKEKAQPADLKTLKLLKEKEELDLIKLLSQLPYTLKMCAQSLEPHGLVAYLQELASSFHYFYDNHRVIGEDANLTRARLFLINATRIVLSNGLGLLGVSAPNKM
jgi:arginyl-tRNA synthetase